MKLFIFTIVLILVVSALANSNPEKRQFLTSPKTLMPSNNPTPPKTIMPLETPAPKTVQNNPFGQIKNAFDDLSFMHNLNPFENNTFIDKINSFQIDTFINNLNPFQNNSVHSIIEKPVQTLKSLTQLPVVQTLKSLPEKLIPTETTTVVETEYIYEYEYEYEYDGGVSTLKATTTLLAGIGLFLYNLL